MALPILAGEFRLVADPELKFSASGNAWATIRLVASSSKRDDDGNWVDDRTLWARLTIIHADIAQNATDTLSKGDLVVVRAKPFTDEWTDDDGVKHSAMGLLIDRDQNCGLGKSVRFPTHSVQGSGPSRGAQRRSEPSRAQGTQPRSQGLSEDSGYSSQPPF